MSSPYPGGFNFGASGNPQQSNLPPSPGNGTMNPFQLLAQMMQGGGQQQQSAAPDLGAMLSGIRQAKDPQGFADKAYIPGQQGPGNPFDNGFFKTAQERQAIEQQHLGGPGFSSLDPAAQQTALMQHQMPNNGMNAVGANPQIQQNPVQQFNQLTSPQGTPQNDQLNLQQNMHMFSPGGMTSPWSFQSGQGLPPPKFGGPQGSPKTPRPSPFSFGF